MNKFKKVGLTALAGSLAAISANAAEMSVSGGVNMTYVSQTGVTGNPYGMESRLTFGTSGELENGMNVSYYTTLETHQAASGQYSGELALDMGDLGTIALSQGVGNAGIDQIDDMSVKAYEEVWDGLTATSSLTNTGGTTAFKYTNSIGGLGLNVAARKGSSTANAEGDVSGSGEGSGYSFALTASGDTLGVDGLNAGFGYGEVDNGTVTNTTVVSDNPKSSYVSAYATYAMGPVSVSAQRNQVNTRTKMVEGDYYAIAFNVNENLAVSYGEITNDHDRASDSTITEDVDGIGISYTMGGMTLAGQKNSSDNANGVAGAKDEHTELRLSFSF
jgi:outer membrane protein OmpU